MHSNGKADPKVAEKDTKVIKKQIRNEIFENLLIDHNVKLESISPKSSNTVIPA